MNVRVPAEVPLYGDLVADVYGEDGASLSQIHVTSYNPAGVMLLDVSDVSRVRGAVNEIPVAPLYGAGTGATRGSAPQILTVGSPRFDPATGDPMLPDRAALYTSADAVVMRSDILARLTGAELDASPGWVLAGGTLAVAVARPEDLRHPTLVAFAGGPIVRQGASAVTLSDLVLPAPASGTGGRSAKAIPFAKKPSNDVAETLAGYTGGNLHGSPLRQLGHLRSGRGALLAFDPTQRPAADDPWASARMVDPHPARLRSALDAGLPAAAPRRRRAPTTGSAGSSIRTRARAGPSPRPRSSSACTRSSPGPSTSPWRGGRVGRCGRCAGCR